MKPSDNVRFSTVEMAPMNRPNTIGAVTVKSVRSRSFCRALNVRSDADRLPRITVSLVIAVSNLLVYLGGLDYPGHAEHDGQEPRNAHDDRVRKILLQVVPTQPAQTVFCNCQSKNKEHARNESVNCSSPSV